MPEMKTKTPVTLNDTDKRAATLAAANLTDNHYHRAIQAAAVLAVEMGRGDWVYHTQHGLGSCVFIAPGAVNSMTLNGIADNWPGSPQ